MSIRLILLALLLPLGAGLFAQTQKPAKPTLDQAQQFVFHAVLEGLYADGVSNEVVDALMTRDEETGMPHHFIYACPVCMPSWDAFAVYRARPGFLGNKLERDTWGEGLDEATRESLMAGTRLQRMDHLRDLVRRWIDDRLDRQRLTPEERQLFQRRFEQMRKKGMEYLFAYQAEENTAHVYRDIEACPFCDAACEAPDR